MSEFGLQDKVAIVTGASSGIGREICEAMGRAGASVVAVGRDEQRLAGTVQAVRDAGGTCHPIATDVVADGSEDRIVDEVLQTCGQLDVIVPAAGVFQPQPFEETPLASFDEQWMVNVRAPFALVRAGMPALKRTRGAVVFISSIAGHVGFPNSSAYCATKGAIELLTKALAMEFAGQGVRFNAVAPGNVVTPLNAHLLVDSEYERAMLAATPAGRIGEVKDIAPAVVFLASDAARYVHGASLLVDGGWVAA